MFYFLIAPFLTYNFLLVAAAVIPAIYLMVRVYQQDRLEKESPAILWKCFRSGVISALIALVLERIFYSFLTASVPMNSPYFNVILYFGIVAFSEEGAKHFMLRKTTWNSYEFNCLYDGIVYASFVSLGFAAWENISYVLHYGFANAVVRAFTAIPGHASFGIFMGVFYSAAKMYASRGDSRSSFLMFLSVLIPALIHGAYDYIATMDANAYYFLIFIIVLFIAAMKVIKDMSGKDRYIS